MVDLNSRRIGRGERDIGSGVRVVKRAGDDFAVARSGFECDIDKLKFQDVIACYL